MTETNAFNNDEKSKRSRRHSSRRHSTSSSVSSGKGGRRHRARKGCSIGAFIGQLLFNFISKILRLIFQLIYGVKGEPMPAITDPVLLESATSLARKIRKQEVRSSIYSACMRITDYLIFLENISCRAFK